LHRFILSQYDFTLSKTAKCHVKTIFFFSDESF